MGNNQGGNGDTNLIAIAIAIAMSSKSRPCFGSFVGRTVNRLLVVEVLVSLMHNLDKRTPSRKGELSPFLPTFTVQNNALCYFVTLSLILYSFTIHWTVHCPTGLTTHSFMFFVHSLTNSFYIYSFIHLFIYLSIHLFIYSSIHFFIYSWLGTRQGEGAQVVPFSLRDMVRNARPKRQKRKKGKTRNND